MDSESDEGRYNKFASERVFNQQESSGTHMSVIGKSQRTVIRQHQRARTHRRTGHGARSHRTEDGRRSQNRPPVRSLRKSPGRHDLRRARSGRVCRERRNRVARLDAVGCGGRNQVRVVSRRGQLSARGNGPAQEEHAIPVIVTNRVEQLEVPGAPAQCLVCGLRVRQLKRHVRVSHLPMVLPSGYGMLAMQEECGESQFDA